MRRLLMLSMILMMVGCSTSSTTNSKLATPDEDLRQPASTKNKKQGCHMDKNGHWNSPNCL